MNPLIPPLHFFLFPLKNHIDMSLSPSLNNNPRTFSLFSIQSKNWLLFSFSILLLVVTLFIYLYLSHFSFHQSSEIPKPQEPF